MARVYSALDACWKDVVDGIPKGQREIEQARLAFIIAGQAPFALDEDELVTSALQQFRQHELMSAA